MTLISSCLLACLHSIQHEVRFVVTLWQIHSLLMCISAHHKCYVCACRGKKVNTATIVTYTLGFTAAALVAILGYVYANRALRKIQARANRPQNGQDSTLNGSAIHFSSAGNVFERLQDSPMDSSPRSRQDMLSQEATYAAQSPRFSASSSPTQERLLQPGAQLVLDAVESPHKQ